MDRSPKLRQLTGALWLLSALVLSLPSCDSGEEPVPPAAPDCARNFAAWEAAWAGAAPLEPLQLVAMDRRLVSNVDGQPSAVSDGTVQSGGLGPLGAGEIVRLDLPWHVGGIRYTPSDHAAPITTYELYAGVTAECFFAEPLAVGSFDGSDQTQEVLFEPTAARYLRLVATGAADGSASFGVGELQVLVAAGFDSAPQPYAVMDAPYGYHAQPYLPTLDPPLYELSDSPADMTIDEHGRIAWIPSAAQTGSHDITLQARFGDQTVEQSFAVHVAPRTAVAPATVPAATGGTVTVADGTSSLDGLTAQVPAAAAGVSGDVTVTVDELSGELPPMFAEAVAVNAPFMITADQPLSGPVELQLSFSSVPELSGEAGTDELLLTTYGTDSLYGYRFDPPDMSYAPNDPSQFAVHNVAAQAEIGQAASAWTELRVREGFRVIYFFELPVDYVNEPGPTDEERSEIRARLDELIDMLAHSRAELLARGCKPLASGEQQEVEVRHDAATLVDIETGRMTLNAEVIDELRNGDVNRPETVPVVTSDVAHEQTHVHQREAMAQDYLRRRKNEWLFEGTAVFSSDEIYNHNRYFEQLKGSKGTWNSGNTAYALRSYLFTKYPYWKVMFFKSLKARNGGFNSCALFDKHGANHLQGHDGVYSLAELLGGRTEFDRAYATWVAAYNGLRLAELMDDAELFEAEIEPFVDKHSLVDAEPLVFKGYTRGGRTARVQSQLSVGQRYTLQVVRPASDYYVMIHDQAGAVLLESDGSESEPELTIAPGDELYLTFTFSQSRQPEPLGGDFEVRLIAGECGLQTSCAGCTETPECVWCEDTGTCIAREVGGCSEMVVDPSGCNSGACNLQTAVCGQSFPFHARLEFTSDGTYSTGNQTYPFHVDGTAFIAGDEGGVVRYASTEVRDSDRVVYTFIQTDPPVQWTWPPEQTCGEPNWPLILPWHFDSPSGRFHLCEPGSPELDAATPASHNGFDCLQLPEPTSPGLDQCLSVDHCLNVYEYHFNDLIEYDINVRSIDSAAFGPEVFAHPCGG